MMAENKKSGMHQNEKAEQADADNRIQGRVDDSRNEPFEEEAQQADISHVDRQEGTMNHGELGGNLGESDAGKQ